MTAFIYSGEHLRLMTCGSCGVKHAIPAVKYDTALEEGGFWYCPNGHQRGFRTGAEKEREAAIIRERDRLKQENARLADEAAATERARVRAVADLKRHKTRSAAGLCPCCNRTFANMTRHMKTKHPDFNVVPLRSAS